MNDICSDINDTLDDPMKRYEELARKTQLDPTKKWGAPKYLFTQNGIGFGPIGDIQMIKAPQKNGKTFLISLMMGALLKGEYLGLKCEVEKPSILYLDTEQHPSNTQLVYRRACKIGGREGDQYHDDIKAYHFRGEAPEDIAGTTMYLIETLRPTVVFIDGIRDLVTDFNDQSESSQMVRQLMQKALEYECSIWSVLHVNPGTDKARGHLGTEMQNKVSDVLCCLKDKKPEGAVFTVSQTDARNRDIQDFSFIIQDVPDKSELIAVPVETHISVKTRTTADDIMARALADSPLRYGDLLDKVMEVAALKKTAAKERISEAIKSKIIVKDEVMQKYSYKGLDLSNEESLPF